MSKLKCPINYNKVEEELCQVLRANELYELQNDAKIRAVEQKVPTYEDFRQMVNGAHLRPMSKSDSKKGTKTAWNSFAKKGSGFSNSNENDP